MQVLKTFCGFNPEIAGKIVSVIDSDFPKQTRLYIVQKVFPDEIHLVNHIGTRIVPVETVQSERCKLIIYNVAFIEIKNINTKKHLWFWCPDYLLDRWKECLLTEEEQKHWRFVAIHAFPPENIQAWDCKTPLNELA